MPELLITMTVIGMLAAVLCGAVTMTLRETINTEGRLNIARSEQSIGYYLPNDLASASATGDTDPSLSPCLGACPEGLDVPGSNALLLTWTMQTGSTGGAIEETRVSYRYSPSEDGRNFEIDRVACVRADTGAPWNCDSRVVLREVQGPDDFTAGDLVSAQIFAVSEPLAPGSGGSDLAAASERKDANRVAVALDGGGRALGAGGGADDVDLTMGGTNRTNITPDSTRNAPTLATSCSLGYYCPVSP